MLSPNFAEGSQSPGGLRRISLPEDDSTALEALSSILHYRLDLTPNLKDPAHLEAFTVAVDKYDCVRAMYLWSKDLLADMAAEAEKYPTDGRLLYPTYSLDEHTRFIQITKHIVMHHGGLHNKAIYGSLRYGIPTSIEALLPEGLLGRFQLRTSYTLLS